MDVNSRLLVSILFAVSACGGDGSGDGNGGVDGGNNADAGSTDAQTVDGWSSLAAVGDGPIQEIAVAAIGSTIYVVGGFNASIQIVQTVQAYDTTSNTWSIVAPVPVAGVHHANLVAHDGKLYILGTLNSTNFEASELCWVYDPGTDTWTSIAPLPGGLERGSGVAAVLGDKLCVAGGFRGGSAVTNFSCYDPGLNEWDISLPSLPAPNDHLVGAVVGDEFLVVGGRNGSVNQIYTEVYSYSTAAGSWELRAPMITGRGGAAAGVIDGKLIVVGGEGNSADPSGVFPQVERYDPVADSWESLGQMPTPRHGMGAAAVGNTLYVPGGADEDLFGAVDVFEAFTPPGA